MRTWTSVDEVRETFSIHDSNSISVRDILKRKLADIHPDRNCGNFDTDNDEEQFHLIMSAITYLDDVLTSTSTLPANMGAGQFLPDIVEQHRQSALDYERLSKTLGESLKKTYNMQRFQSAVLVLAITGVLAFSQTLATNLLVGKIFQYVDNKIPFLTPLVGLMLLFLLVVGCVLFSTTWIREQRARAFAERLVTDEALTELFRSYSLRNTRDGRFSSREILQAIQTRFEFRDRWFRRFLPRSIRKALPHRWQVAQQGNYFATDPLLAQQATDLIIHKLEKRNAIIRIETPSLVPEYRLAESIRQEIDDDLL